MNKKDQAAFEEQLKARAVTLANELLADPDEAESINAEIDYNLSKRRMEWFKDEEDFPDHPSHVKDCGASEGDRNNARRALAEVAALWHGTRRARIEAGYIDGGPLRYFMDRPVILQDGKAEVTHKLTMIMARGAYCYGKGVNAAVAIDNARKEGGRDCKAFELFAVTDDVTIDGMGFIQATRLVNLGTIVLP